MITITKQNDGVLFEFEDSKKYLYGNGSILVPFNTLSIVADESDMITLKKAASNDVFISARYDTDLGYRSKDDAIDDLKDLLFAETGGGSGSGVTPSEVQEMIDESISGKADTSDVTAVANDVQTVSGQVATKVATTDFNAYSAATDSRLAEDEEVTAAALNDLQENKADTSAVTAAIDAAITGKADTSAVTAVNNALTAHTSDTGIHVSAQEKNAWNAKAEPYSAGTGIEISGNVISATGGGVLVINSEDLMNNMTDEKWDELANALENDIPIFSVIDASDEGITDIQQFPVNGMIIIDENEGTTEITLNQLFGGGYYDIHIQKNGSEDYSVTGGGGGSYVYYTEDTSSESATIKVQNDDGAGNLTENRVFVDGGDIIIESYNETDDGEGNTGTTDTQVDINSLGLSIIASSDDGIDTTQTELEVQPMGAYINSEPIATEPYVDAATSGKVDTSAITTAITSGSTDSEIPTAKAVYDAIPTGGGATYSAGTNISIDTGNTINCTIPAYFNSNALTGDIAIGTNINNVNYTYSRVVIGRDINSISNSNAVYSIGIGVYGGTTAKHNLLQGSESVGIGKNFEITNNVWGAIAIGSEAKSNIHKGLAIGYHTVASGTTQTNINNQIKVDTNNQVYIKDKTNTTDVCIQDAIAALGGLKFVKLTQSEYDNLSTKDNDTLYIITNVVS